MRNKRLCKWLRSGVVKKNIKNTLDCTIDTLYEMCHLKNVTRENISSSLENILLNDMTFRNQHMTLYNWFQSHREQNKTKSKPFAVFRKTRVYSSAFGSHINYNVTSSSDNSTGDAINIENESSINISTTPGQIEDTRDSSPPPVRRIYSFTGPEQGAIVETFLTLAEKALYNFLIRHEGKISEKVVRDFAASQIPPINKDFRDADVLCMLKFIIQNIKLFLKESAFHGLNKTNPIELLDEFKKKVRNKNAHGVVENDKGRWCDLDLQRVVQLTCEVAACLGNNYKEAYTAKEKFDKEIHHRWRNEITENNSYESLNFLSDLKNIGTSLDNKNSEGSKTLKRKLGETDLDEMTDFILIVLNKVKERDAGEKQKILQLSLEENEPLIKIWRTALIKKNESDQINKFISLVNSMFNTVSIQP
ncbi:4919_t:CDS:1 [Racocetra persica]|uniref:4919_t:CDS:1 n=1 Tax=Racocetra persica TaxID=160502 RepID=A0ACA9LDF7_9GLOM|nr:4919_t:CDS:1 [Racocetra persica]